MKSYNQHSRQSGAGDFMANVSRGARVAGCWIKYVLTLLGEKVVEYTEARSELKEQRERDKERAAQSGRGYGDRGKRSKKRKPAWLRAVGTVFTLLGRGLATLLLIGVITGCIVGAASMVYILVYLDKDIEFDLHQLKLSYTSTIYVEDGKDENDNVKYVEFQKLHGSQNREWVDYSAIPDTVKEAVVAIEDHRFWTHSGVDWKRTVYCFAAMFLHFGDGDAQGGSTITQQLIKNVTGDDEVSIDRKLKEIFRALELEKQYTKAEILESYLNVIALGNGCNGIKSAAQTYFDKDISELTLAESACLVGITKNPSQYNPLYRPEKNKKRQEDVLWAMYQYGYIQTKAEFDAAAAEVLDFNEKALYNSENRSYNNWYVDQIIWDLFDELQEYAGMSEAEARYAVYNGGLQIYSCMDKTLQEKAEAIFRDPSNFRKFPGTTQPQCAIAVMDYEGAVKCIVGARGNKTGDVMYSMASHATRQPGSSMKPISSYGPAVAYGILEFSTPVSDTPLKNYNNGKDWPKNSGGVYRGNIPAVKGLEVSANCVAVRIAKVLTPQRSFEFMTDRLKLTTLVKTGDHNDINLSASIGGLTNGVTVLEMTAAYVPFGSGGVYHSPYTYTKVVDANGDVIIEHGPEDGERAMSAESATIMNRMLRAPVTGSSGTARSAAFGGYPMFGKTGTTSNDYDRYYGGGTPYYVACCWFGYEVQKELSIKNVNHALQAWKKIMIAAHEGKSNSKGYNLSSNVSSRSYCTITGGLASASCPSTATGWYARNTSMPICPVHGGGSMTSAFTRFITDTAAFVPLETSSTEESTTTLATTTPPPIITTEPSETTTTTTTTTTTATTTESTMSTTEPIIFDPNLGIG